MNNKWVKALIGIGLWGFLARNTFSDRPGIIGDLMHGIAGLLPATIFGVASLVIVFVVFTFLFIILLYFALFNAKQ